MWGKQSYLATSREDVREAIRLWRLDLLIHFYHLYTLQSTGDV